jgi:hypothetical protein
MRAGFVENESERERSAVVLRLERVRCVDERT